MNREKILFLVVLVIAGLWGVSTLAGPYEPPPAPQPRTFYADVPTLKEWPGLAESARFLTLVSGRPDLAIPHEGTGRTVFVPHSDLLPVEAAVIDAPGGMATPWVLPPVGTFPGTGWYRWFLVAEIPIVPGVEEAEPENGAAAVDDEEEEEDRGPSEAEVLEDRKREFVASEWDKLYPETGEPYYGTISLPEEETKQGHTKYELLLPEGRTIKFYWEQIDPKRMQVQYTGNVILEGSRYHHVEFADTIANRYWSRRTEDRVGKGDARALVDLGRWVMDLAEEEKYDRMEGLSLAAKTFREALAAAPGDANALLALGEALHRQFRFDEELGLYQEALAAKATPDLYYRLARIYVVLDLPDAADEALTKALAMASGDTRCRLLRAKMRYEAGRYDDARSDFEDAERLGSPEEKTTAREGRARCLVALGEPEKAANMLAGVDDPESLTTRGAALYALRKWDEALAALGKAAELAPESARTTTLLGFAQAMTAKDAAGLDRALETLAKGRELDPLNYFWPPLGRGFAEQRRGRPVESVDAYSTAAMALPNEPYVHYALGRSYLRDGRYEDARNEFLKAVGFDYRFVDALFGAGTAYLEQGQFASARDYLGRTVEMQRRVYEAERDLARRTAAKEALVRARYRLGRAWLVSDDAPIPTRLKNALEQFQAILDLDEAHVKALNAKAYVLYQQGDPEEALVIFQKIPRLAPADSEEAAYAKAATDRIRDSLARRRWTDSFSRPDAPQVGGKWWSAPMAGTFGFRIANDQAVLRGTPPAAGGIWLVTGDPSVPSSSRNNLGDKFIRASTTLEVKPGLVDVHFILFRRGRGTDTPPQAVAGLGRGTKGEVVIVSKAANAKNESVEPLKDEQGNTVMWPDGPVTLGIQRIQDDGVIALSLNGERVATVDVGMRKINGPLELGFRVYCLQREPVDVAIEEVQMELYVQ